MNDGNGTSAGTHGNGGEAQPENAQVLETSS